MNKKKQKFLKMIIALCLQVKWRRLVLDEAHCIKDRRSSTAKAVFALTSKYKWALSGTPLQVCAPSLKLLSSPACVSCILHISVGCI